MGKVYIVTAGTYSDYHIEQAFSTREKAQEYLDHVGSEDARIEEYDLDEETPRGIFGYCVKIPKNGGEAKVELCDFDNYPKFRKDAFQYYKCINVEYVWFNVEAKDAPHAIKIASERLMQVKAMPYLFPRLKEQCVCHKSYSLIEKSTPIYDYNAKEIILCEGDWIEPYL